MSAADVRRAAEAIRAGSSTRHLVLLSDFDGTLCEFQIDPESVRLPDARRALLESIGGSGNATVAIVSGRRLDDVRARAELGLPAYYAGLHGLEIAGPDGGFRHPDIEATVALVQELVTSLAEAVARLKGVFIENKQLSLVVHYRDASPPDAARVTEAFPGTRAARSSGFSNASRSTTPIRGRSTSATTSPTRTRLAPCADGGCQSPRRRAPPAPISRWTVRARSNRCCDR